MQAVETAVVPGIFLAATTRATCARAYFLADSTSLHPPLRPTARRAPCLRPSQPSYPCARACSCRGFIRRYVFDFSVTVHVIRAALRRLRALSHVRRPRASPSRTRRPIQRLRGTRAAPGAPLLAWQVCAAPLCTHALTRALRSRALAALALRQPTRSAPSRRPTLLLRRRPTAALWASQVRLAAVARRFASSLPGCSGRTARV